MRQPARPRGGPAAWPPSQRQPNAYERDSHVRRDDAPAFEIQLTDEVLKEHYAHIASKPFFPEVAGFMKSRPVIALALAGDGVISKVRDLLGPTDSKAAAKGTIRGDFGEDKMVNMVHASDSPEAAAVELKRFFRADELFDL